MTLPFASRRVRVAFALASSIVVAAAAYVVVFSGPRTPAELASYLPNKDGALIYLDVDAMRKSGILDLVAGSKAVEEPD